MFYRKNIDGSILDFSTRKYANDCLETSENIIKASNGNYYLESELPPLTEEELLDKAKAERAEAVSKIIVEVDGMKFDGDETAQTRMGRTISAAIALGVDLNTEKRAWVLADNTVAKPTIAQLAKALELAGNEQTRLWTVPYQSDSEEDTVAISSIGID